MISKKTKTKFILFILTFLTIGIMLLPSNVVADEGTTDRFANTIFFEEALEFDYDLVDRDWDNFHDPHWDYTPAELGIFDWYKLGQGVWNEERQRMEFLSLVQYDVDVWVFTQYTTASDIFYDGTAQPSSRTWLSMWWQRNRPYDDGSSLAEYKIEFKEIIGGTDVNSIRHKDEYGNPILGFDTYFDIEALYTPFAPWIGVTDNETEVAFGIDSIQLSSATLRDTNFLENINSEYNHHFVTEGIVEYEPEFEGVDSTIGSNEEVDGIDDIADDVRDRWVFNLNDHFHYGSIDKVSLLTDPMIYPNVAGSNPKVYKSENTVSTHIISQPELNIWKQSFDYMKGTLSVDVHGIGSGIQGPFPDAMIDGVLQPNDFRRKFDERAVGYAVSNPATKLEFRLNILVYGSAELSPNLRESLLEEPEFIRGDVFWDIAFFGDESASLLFTKTYLQKAWDGFWSGDFGGKLKNLIVVVVILAVIAGGFLGFMKLRNSGMLGGGGKGEKTTIIATKGTTVNYTDTDVDPSASKVASRQKSKQDKRPNWIQRKQNYRRTRKKRN